MLKEVLIFFASLMRRLVDKMAETEEHAWDAEAEEEEEGREGSIAGVEPTRERPPSSREKESSTVPAASSGGASASGNAAAEAEGKEKGTLKPEERTEELLERALHMIDWLIQLVKFFGDGMRRLVCEVLHEVPAPDSSRFEAYASVDSMEHDSVCFLIPPSFVLSYLVKKTTINSERNGCRGIATAGSLAVLPPCEG